MAEKKTIKGITWGHSRGITPLLAVAQRFNELNPGVEVRWHKRSLQQFADMPIEHLTKDYDLLIIDHPWVGCAAATNCVLPLEKYLPQAYLNDQLKHSVGGSHESYNYNDHQWALAIDAAAPAASYRPDLFELANAGVPTTWQELLVLASAGKVAVPAIPIDLLMNFYSFCIANGQRPFLSEDRIVDEAVGLQALNTMKQLYSLIDKKFFDCNPIAVAELMSSSNDYWYCAFAYGYSNYARLGYAAHVLQYTDVVEFSPGKKIQTTVGGTGIAISAFTKEKELAVAFAQMVCSPLHQQTFYVQHGGQPGHAAAWNDELANRLTNNFFRDVRPVMDRGYIRPRYNGYLHFQDHAGDPLHTFLRDGGDPYAVLKKMNDCYFESMAVENKPVSL